MISFLENLVVNDMRFVKKITLTGFSGKKKITHSKCVIYDSFYSQYNNIIASKLVVWVNLGNNLTECVEYQQQQSKITLGV